MKEVTKSILVVLIPLLFHFTAQCQEISIEVIDSPLNKVLIGIIDSSDVNISFDDELLSTVKITCKKNFADIKDALSFLLSNTQLEYESINDVWIIYPTIINENIYISGVIVDKKSNEALPFSHVSIEGWPIVSDISGNFSHTTTRNDSLIPIIASHLGYYILDTLIKYGEDIRLQLMPSVVGLNEIVINGKRIEKSTQFGDQPGLIKLNHKIAHYLPGYGDNSVFNLIRLMPGILAAGEQSSDITIWGCYAGQSEVIFDGYTVFGLKNFNDNISAFNPLLAKNIEIHKGGYDANFGGRVGGIVNIIGVNGNTQKPTFTININNMTFNGMVDIPITKRSSLIMAFRHTYYNLYDRTDISTMFSNSFSSDSTTDITINPNYLFRDANIKYSNTLKNNDLLFLSLHVGEDNFKYSIHEPINNRIINKSTSEENTQIGGSGYYNHNWNNGNITSILVSYSSLNSTVNDDFKIEFPQTGNIEYKNDNWGNNYLQEYSIKLKNSSSINNIHTIETGIDLTQSHVKLDEYSFNAMIAYFNKSASRFSAFIQDNISVTKNLGVKVGLRLNQSSYLSSVYIEPRFSATLKAGDKWRFSSAIGVYNQFITLSTISDDFGNYRYFWTIADNEDIPVLKSVHYVLGARFIINNLTFNIDAYHKSVIGLTRFVNLNNYNIQDIFHGNSTSNGIDILIKKDSKRFSTWISYSLSKTMENFQYYNIDDTRRAPQDQRHEIKLAAMINLNPVYISSNYVYGSGFPYGNGTSINYEDNLDYSRLDLSVIYKFIDRKLKGEVGISLINVLNTKNIKYQSFEKIPEYQTNGINIISEAIPFTPTLYLKIAL